MVPYVRCLVQIRKIAVQESIGTANDKVIKINP